MFWICAENSIDNTEMVFVIAEQCLHRVKAFASHIAQQWVGWGCTKSWERTQPRQLTSTDQRDVPRHVMSCSACKVGARRRKEGTFRVMVFVFPHNCYA